MRRLLLRLFGGPLLFEEGRLVRLSPNQTVLLGLLGLERGSGLPRHRATDLLWPSDGLSSSPRHRLAQLIYSTNRRIGAPVIGATGDLLHLNMGLIDTDLAEITRLLSARELPTDLPSLEPTLMGLLPPSAEEAARDWIRARELAIRGDLRRLALDLWARCVAAGDWSAGTVVADFLLGLDPLDEHALQRILRAHALSGRVQEAEVIYHSFRATAEAGGDPWLPAPATTELLARIRSFGPAGWRDPKDAHGPPREVQLTGRSAELLSLNQALQPGSKGMSIVLVSGEAGIGKTRLLREALSIAALEGATVLSGSCSHFEQDIPLNPLLDALGVEGTAGAARVLPPPWRTIILSLLPGLQEEPGTTSAPPMARAGETSRRLLEAILLFLETLSERQRLVLVLEDVHWADDTSVLVIDYLRKRWKGHPFTIVLSARPEEVRAGTSIGRLLIELRASRLVKDVVVEGLSDQSSLLLAERIAGRVLTPGERTRISRLGGTNPLYLIEWTLELLAGRLTGAHDADDPLAIPDAIRRIYEPRLQRLDAAADRCLALISEMEEPSSPRTIGRLARLSRAQCLQALEDLEEARLIAWTGPRVDVYHALIRETVQSRLSTGQRSFLHGRIAGDLLGRDPTAVERLALHFDKAGMGAEALRFALQAAHRAEQTGAVSESLCYLAIARRYTVDDEEAATITGRMGHLHYLHREFAAAIPLLGEAGVAFRKLGWQAEALRARIELLESRGHDESLPLPMMLAEVKELGVEAFESELWPEVARGLDLEIHLLDRAEDPDGVRLLLGKAATCLSRTDAAEARSTLNRVLAFHLYYGDPARAIEAARDAVRDAREAECPDHLLNSLNRLMVVLLHVGRLDSPEGVAAVAEAEQLAAVSGDLFLRYNVRLNVGVWALDTGDYERAAAAFNRAGHVVRSQQDLMHLVLCCNLGELYLGVGAPEAALEAFTEAERMFTPEMPGYLDAVIRAGLGLCSLRMGRIAQARVIAEGLPSRRSRWVFDPSLIALFRAELLSRLGQRDSALSLLDEVCEDLKDRLITNWVKLRLTQHRIAAKGGVLRTKELAVTTEVAAELSLRIRLDELARLRQRATA